MSVFPGLLQSRIVARSPSNRLKENLSRQINAGKAIIVIIPEHQSSFLKILPSDIQIEIFLHFPKEDYLKILEICEYYQIGEESSHLWKLLWERDCGSEIGMNLKDRYILSMRVYNMLVDEFCGYLYRHVKKIMKIFYHLGADKLIVNDLLENPSDLKGILELFIDKYVLDYDIADFLLKCGAKFGDDFLSLARNDKNLAKLSIGYYANYDPNYD